MPSSQNRPSRRTPAIVQEQGQLLLEAFQQALQDPMASALWRWLCHLLATEFKIPYTGWADVRAECQRLHPSATVEDILPRTDWDTAQAMAQRLQQRQTVIANSLGPFLHDWILAAALWELDLVREWPHGLEFGMIRLLPDNPLWICSHDGSIQGTEAATPDHLRQLADVRAVERGDKARRGRPRRAKYFRSREEFRDVIVHLIRLCESKGMEPTQPRIAAFLRLRIRAMNASNEMGEADPLLSALSAMNVEHSTETVSRLLRDNCKRFGFTWDELIQMAHSPQ